MTDLHHSPLEAAHSALNARLVPFAGWVMPVQYSSIMAEHHAVRNSAGIFDISHMGQFFVGGPRATAWLDSMLTNRISSLQPGQGQYTLMLNDAGGVIDDLIAYRLDSKNYFLVVNASMIPEDEAWLRAHLEDGVEFRNDSTAWAGMAIQGPCASDCFARTFPDGTLPPRNGIAVAPDGAIICRTGYTGEDGFEYFVPTSRAEEVWNTWISAGAVPCGLGARDSLRLEMGYPLNGSDLSPTRSPIEAGLGFFCDLTKGPFIGSETLQNQKNGALTHRLTAIQSTEKSPPWRSHYPVTSADGVEIGELSSGVLSPSLLTGIGMAYLPVDFSTPGTPLQIVIRGRSYPATVVKKPFYRK